MASPVMLILDYRIFILCDGVVSYCYYIVCCRMAFDCIALYYCIVFLSYGIVRWSIVFLVLDLTWLSWSVVWRLLSLSWLSYSLSLSLTGVMRGWWSKPCFDFAWLCLTLLDFPWSDGRTKAKTSFRLCLILLDLRCGLGRKPCQDWAWLCLIFAWFEA
jgi:hypothetical protein